MIVNRRIEAQRHVCLHLNNSTHNKTLRSFWIFKVITRNFLVFLSRDSSRKWPVTAKQTISAKDCYFYIAIINACARVWPHISVCISSMSSRQIATLAIVKLCLHYQRGIMLKIPIMAIIQMSKAYFLGFVTGNDKRENQLWSHQRLWVFVTIWQPSNVTKTILTCYYCLTVGLLACFETFGSGVTKAYKW